MSAVVGLLIRSIRKPIEIYSTDHQESLQAAARSYARRPVAQAKMTIFCPSEEGENRFGRDTLCSATNLQSSLLTELAAKPQSSFSQFDT